MERTSVAFTTLVLCAGVAHAAHPHQDVERRTQPEGTAQPLDFVATRPLPAAHPLAGKSFVRQLVEPQPAAAATGRAQSRVIYLNRDGAVLVPGINDSRLQTSSIVTEPTAITPWEIDDEMWTETVACMNELFAPFDVRITDQDPGDVAHIEAVFGGHPADVGLPDNVAGVSPFTTDCSVIESSVVFTFTDVLPDDARLMCEVMAQEIAHSYGLDHQLLAEDPMSYLDYPGERTFQDEDARCGEFEARPCGIDTYVCRARQNSVALLTQRLGARGSAGNTDQGDATPADGVAGGCSTGGGLGGPWLLGLGALLVRRRARRCRGLPASAG